MLFCPITDPYTALSVTPWLERIGCSKIELKKLVTDCNKTDSPGSALAKASRLGLFGVEEDYGSYKKDCN